jgi:tubulin polyglutamylase TTLL11
MDESRRMDKVREEIRKVSKGQELRASKSPEDIVPKKVQKKVPRKDVILVTEKNCRGEFGLFRHFFETGEWEKSMNHDKCFFNYFALDNGESFEHAKFQWTNRLPGVGKCSHKTETFGILNKFRSWHPETFNFYPKTFILPQQEDAYIKYHKKNKSKTFVSKITTGSQGYGIRILKSPKDLAGNTGRCDLDEKIVQEYIPRPFLLRNKKHDLRIYVAVVSYNPLVAFINTEGLARFCTQDYEEPTAANKNNENVHFTNYSLNKHSSDYNFTEETTEIHDGSKRTLTSYWKELEMECGVKKDSIWEDIKSQCASIMKAFKPWIQYNCLCEWGVIPKGKKTPKAFHIFGFDVIFDSKMKPWLLESNGNPSLNVHFEPDEYKQKKREEAIVSPIDVYVKSRVLGDIVMMVKKHKIRYIREELDEFRTYEKIFDESIEDADYGECSEYDSLLEMFIFLGGYKFFPSLTMTKFSKVTPWFNGVGSKKIERIDCDVAWKKIQNVGGCMTFDGFVWSILDLVRKSMNDPNPEDTDVQDALIEVITNFEGEKDNR